MRIAFLLLHRLNVLRCCAVTTRFNARSGAFSIVYRATCKKTGKDFAVKIIDTKHRDYNEARAAPRSALMLDLV